MWSKSQKVMLWLRMSRLRFIAARMGLSDSSRLTARNTARSRHSSIYRHCSELPLAIFIDCICNMKLDRLIRSGKASYSELTAAWEQIYSEYCDLMNTHEYRLYMLLAKEIGHLKSKMLAVACCVDALRIRYSEKSVTMLRQYGYAYQFDYKDRDAYQADIDRVVTRSKAMNIAYKIKKKEMEELEKDSEPLREQDFTDMITHLSKFIGYRIDPQVTTVSEFASIRKAHENEIKALKKQNEKSKAG